VTSFNFSIKQQLIIFHTDRGEKDYTLSCGV